MKAWPRSQTAKPFIQARFWAIRVGCAMALASLKELEQKKRYQRAQATVGKHGSMKRLQKKRCPIISHVGDVRGIGLMIGIELVKDRRRSLAPDAERMAQVLKACLKRGLFILGGGKGRNVISITPPLDHYAARDGAGDRYSSGGFKVNSTLTQDIERFLRTGQGDFEARLALELFAYQFSLNSALPKFLRSAEQIPGVDCTLAVERHSRGTDRRVQISRGSARFRPAAPPRFFIRAPRRPERPAGISSKISRITTRRSRRRLFPGC